MRSFTLSQVASLIGGSVLTEHESINICGVNVDSRLVQPGNLFFALPGAQSDGHAHIAHAIVQGAVAAVVTQSHLSEMYSIPLIVVADALDALQAITRHILDIQKCTIIGVTGSIGKTTTKDLITTLLKQKYRVASSPGNSNSQIGLPLSILNHTDGQEEILVLEMGMTHAGQISKLLQMAPPDIAVITAVELVHAANFSSLNDIGRAKAEIFSHSRTKLGILPVAVVGFNELSQIGSCVKSTFSVQSERANYFILNSNENTFCVSEYNQKSPLLPNLKLSGQHNLHNFLAAVVVARYLKLTWEDICKGISKLALPERRFQTVEKDGILFINDAYNASSTSIKAAFNSLPTPLKGGRKIAVIGEILELGKFSEACHIDVGHAALNAVDLLFCLGKACAPLHHSWVKANRPTSFYLDRADLVQELRKQIKPGDVVLLKGSRPNQLWKVLEEI